MTVKLPCEVKKPIIIGGHLCKYILDVIDGEIFGTDSYEWFNLYKNIFFEVKKAEHLPVFHDGLCKSLATSDAWKNALEQEKQRYADGYRYISEWVNIDGVLWKKGRWIKSNEGAK